MKNLERTEPKVADLFILEEGRYQIWEKTNMPVLLESEKVFLQKQQYIEYNPVRKNYVELPENWLNSSANSHSPIKIDEIQD